MKHRREKFLADTDPRKAYGKGTDRVHNGNDRGHGRGTRISGKGGSGENRPGKNEEIQGQGNQDRRDDGLPVTGIDREGTGGIENRRMSRHACGDARGQMEAVYDESDSNKNEGRRKDHADCHGEGPDHGEGRQFLEKDQEDSRGNENEGKHAGEAVDHNAQEDRALRLGSFLDGIKDLHQVASRTSRQEEVVEHPDHHQLPDPEPGEGDPLHAHEQLPPERSADKDKAKTEEGGNQPERIGLPEGLEHLGPLGGIVEDPPEQKHGDRGLDNGDEDFLEVHGEKRSRHRSAAAMISGDLARGESSRTYGMSLGRIGTSRSKSTSPAKGIR